MLILANARVILVTSMRIAGCDARHVKCLLKGNAVDRSKPVRPAFLCAMLLSCFSLLSTTRSFAGDTIDVPGVTYTYTTQERVVDVEGHWETLLDYVDSSGHNHYYQAWVETTYTWETVSHTGTRTETVTIPTIPSVDPIESPVPNPDPYGSQTPVTRADVEGGTYADLATGDAARGLS